jgi:von Willebrand factor type A domain
MFEAFINRTLAYNIKSHIGLITFSTRPFLQQAITDVIEDFRSAVRFTFARGDTALWDALALAQENLSEYGEQFPDAKKRIICLSDGDDTKSIHTAQEVCLALQVFLFNGTCSRWYRKIISYSTLLLLGMNTTAILGRSLMRNRR